MDLRNCRKCQKLFSYVSKPICPECEKEDELDFETVRVYLKDNPGTTIQRVSDETGVSPSSIMRYLKAGKLEVSEGSSPMLTCEKCGKPIFLGRFCRECSESMSKHIARAAGPVPKPMPSSETKQKSTVSMSLSKEKLSK